MNWPLPIELRILNDARNMLIMGARVNIRPENIVIFPIDSSLILNEITNNVINNEFFRS